MKFDLLREIFFPRRCFGCGKKLREGALCAQCRSTITIARTLFCGDCGQPIPAARARSFCHPALPCLLGAAASYENAAVKELVHALKFRNVKRAAEPLAEMLIRYGSALEPPLAADAVIPIPLSKKRLRARGFNQSEEIARRFAEHFSLPLEPSWLARVRHAKPQSETKDLAERRENIRGSFLATAPEKVAGRNIVLIDDVTTSGATFLEAARTLKDAGARTIYALAATRVVK